MLIPGGRWLHALDAGQPSAAHLLHVLRPGLSRCLSGCVLLEGLSVAVQRQRCSAHAQDVSELQPLLRTFPALRKRISSVVDAGCALCSPVPCLTQCASGAARPRVPELPKLGTKLLRQQAYFWPVVAQAFCCHDRQAKPEVASEPRPGWL